MIKKEVIIIFGLLLLMPIVSAGVGLKWDKETALVNEGEKTCLQYSVYNPWPEDSMSTIEVSDSLKGVLIMQDTGEKLVPANTSSTNAIPINFCFKVPDVYSKDCLVGNYLCKQECKEEQKVYEGEVIVKALPAPNSISGSGGSSTQMSVSAPLRLRVVCNAHGRDYTIVYVFLAIISLIIIIILLSRKYRKPKVERDREQLKKLKEEIKKESKRNK